MFTSGYLKLIKLQLIYIISSLQHGFPFSQTPMITSDTGFFDTVITCSITGQETVPVSFYEEDRLVVQIKTSSGYCQQDPPNLPNNVRCSCLGVNASCTVSTGAHGDTCTRWKCAVPIKGVLQYSQGVNVCRIKHTRLTTKIIDADNCSNNLFNEVIWTIHGLNIKYNMILSILKTYNTANLSSFMHKYQTHTRASITACRLETLAYEEKTLDIMDPSELCELDSLMPVNKPCNITDLNPTVSIIREPTIGSKCPSIPRTPIPEVLALCDAVNRVDAGAQKFVGNKVGHFKLELFFRASVGEFFIEGFINQTHITFYDTNPVTILCRGDGHPAPEILLLKNGFQYSRGKSTIRYTMTPSGSHDTGMYTCVAANALGKDSKAIQINFHVDKDLHQGETENTNKKDAKQSTVFIVAVCCTVAGSLFLLTLSVCILKRGYTCVSPLVRIFRSTTILESNNNINANSAHSDMNTGTNYAFFEGRFPDDETHSSGVVNVHVSSIEIAEMSHAFDNETYAESIKILEEGPVNNYWPAQQMIPHIPASWEQLTQMMTTLCAMAL
ncbi:uncharacterized protein LOC127869518 isoform X2 [Dreissena polymorpha]|uniref:uncharacterized protein LOC127869518 isoform X2 n=1 Tax=Dreissena polymorpha TaxID=45954 RepID=UPI0022648900|nr:uncharacterized protein LOC127869518 isoform X2 [Dreissena polymorpha]